MSSKLVDIHPRLRMLSLHMGDLAPVLLCLCSHRACPVTGLWCAWHNACKLSCI